MIVVALMIGCGKPPATQNPILVKANELYSSGGEENLAKAVETVDGLLAKEPTNFDALSLRGQIHKKWGKTDQAIQDFTKLIALDPKKPDGYAFRSQVYEDKKLLLDADGVSGSPEWMKLHELAQADRKKHYAFDPTSVDALKAPSSGSASAKELLDTPVPGYDPLEESEDSVAQNDAVDPDEGMGDENEGEDQEHGFEEDTGPGDGLASPTKLTNPIQPTKMLTNDGTANSEDVIAERDLARDENDEVEDDPLPHDNDQNVVTTPQITRNDLESFLPPQTATDPFTNIYSPQRDPSTTGFNSPQGNLPNRSALNGNAGQANGLNPNGLSPNGLNPNGLNPNAPAFITPRNQTGFTAFNQVPPPGSTTQTPRNTTGFNSTRTTSPSNVASPYPWLQGVNGTRTANAGLSGPTGFLPPEAQGQFGPRLGTAGIANQGLEADPTQGRLPLPSSRPLSPPLTMALPGTAQPTGRPISTTGSPVPITTGAPISTVNPFDRSLAPNLTPTVIQTPPLPAQ